MKSNYRKLLKAFSLWMLLFLVSTSLFFWETSDVSAAVGYGFMGSSIKTAAVGLWHLFVD